MTPQPPVNARKCSMQGRSTPTLAEMIWSSISVSSKRVSSAQASSLL